MPFDIGIPELILILVVVLLVFGVGRLSRIGGELGQAIHAFRKGVNGDPRETNADAEKEDKTNG
jgi:sec-independent protein translocase protein TatA